MDTIKARIKVLKDTAIKILKLNCKEKKVFKTIIIIKKYQTRMYKNCGLISKGLSYAKLEYQTAKKETTEKIYLK